MIHWRKSVLKCEMLWILTEREQTTVLCVLPPTREITNLLLLEKSHLTNAKFELPFVKTRLRLC